MITDLTDKTFNLVKDKWLPVFDGQKEGELSLLELFQTVNSDDKLTLIGDSHTQSLVLLRFLLAITQSVYPSQAAQDELWEQGKFDDKVINYLQANQDKFDMFGDHPFYQVTLDEFNSLVVDKDKVYDGKERGVLLVKQMNRNINESANTPNIFAPKTNQTKNDLTMSEFVRWLITYQNVTGSTDKINVDLGYKFQRSAGWLYKLNPVYLQNTSLFKTIVGNMLPNDIEQKPIWDWDIKEYVEQINELPDNLAQLYTLQSRLLYIAWDGQTPTLYTAALPMPDRINATIEPMTTWRVTKSDELIPAVRNLDNIHSELLFEINTVLGDNGATILKHTRDDNWTLVNVNYINDGNPTSQIPAYEYFSTCHYTVSDKDKLIDNANMVQEIIKSYWIMQNSLQKFRSAKDDISRDRMSQKIVNKEVNAFIEALKTWYRSYSPMEDANKWKVNLRTKVGDYTEQQFAQRLTKRDMSITREDKPHNVFEITNLFFSHLKRITYVKED